MKALSLTQPWAQLVVEGRKQYETRSWTTTYRGLLAIHAAKRFPGYAKDFASTELTLGRLPSRGARGAIIGVVRLVNIQPTQEVELEVSALERYYGDYSYGRWAWQFELVLKLDEPIPFSGSLGLWNVPQELESLLAVLL